MANRARKSGVYSSKPCKAGTLEEIPSKVICQKLVDLSGRVRSPISWRFAAMNAPKCARRWVGAIATGQNRRFDVGEQARRRAAQSVGKRRSKSRIVRRFDAGLVARRRRTERYLHFELGIARPRAFSTATMSWTTPRFAALADGWREQPRPIERPYFLTVNRFIERKNLARVLEAWSALSQAQASA